MKSERSRRPLRKVMALAVLLLLAGGGFWWMQSRAAKHAVTYLPQKVTRGDIQQTILSTGVVAAQNRLDLKPPVAGRIEKVLVQEGQVVRKGQVLAWMSSTERAALIDTAQAKGKEEVAYWEGAYKMTPLLAPGHGLVILKNVDAGQTVTQADTVVSLSDRLIVKANVDETDLAEVALGQEVNLVLDAFSSKPLASKVVHIGYDAKTVSNVTTYEVDIQAENNPPYMKSGMTANVTFLIAQSNDALLVPASAVRRVHKKNLVYVPAADPKAPPEEREVEIGISDGKKIEIRSGLADGDTILIPVVRAAAKKDEKETNPFAPARPRGGKH